MAYNTISLANIAEPIKEKVMQWCRTEFLDEIKEWVLDEICPIIQDWIISEYSPTLEEWLTKWGDERYMNIDKVSIDDDIKYLKYRRDMVSDNIKPRYDRMIQTLEIAKVETDGNLLI